MLDLRGKHVRLLTLFVVIVMVVSPLQRPAQAIDPLTVGGLVLLGNFVRGQIQQVIATAGSTAQGVLADLDNKIAGMLNSIEAKGEHILDLAVADLDAYTRGTLSQFANLLDQASGILSGIVGQIDNAVTNQIANIANQIDAQRIAFQESARTILIEAGLTGTYIMEQGAHYTFGLIALVVGLIGLIVFAAALITSKGLPSGCGGILSVLIILLFIGVSGAILFVPDARALAIQQFRGPGLAERFDEEAQRPIIFRAVPASIMLGSTPTPELRLHGAALQPNGERPSALIGGRSVPVLASDDTRVVLDVRSFPPSSNSSLNVELVYPTTTARPNFVVQFTTPTPTPRILTQADLRITSFTLNPARPTVGEPVKATLQIVNSGEMPAVNFRIEWKPTGSEVGGKFLGNLRLNGGQSTTIEIPDSHSYSNAGTYTSQAFVDSGNEVAESNEQNNSLSTSVTVSPRPQQLVLSRYFVFYPSISDISRNTTYAPSETAYGNCFIGFPFDMSRFNQCFTDGTLSTTPMQIQFGNRIVIRTRTCNSNASGSDPKPNCITGGFGRPGSWGPDGAPGNPVFAPEFPFEGTLFALGVQLGGTNRFQIGSAMDYTYNGSPTNLYLLINDTNLSDNQGSWTGNIEIWR